MRFGRQLALVVASGVLVATAAGCILVGGSDRYESKNPTLGRQLQDLKAARDTSAITPEEYESTKARLLSNAPSR